MPTAAIDFETYYKTDEVSVTNLGIHNLCDHPDFEAYLVSIVTDTGIRWVGHPSEFDFRTIAGEDWTWVSHNAAFDNAVYDWLARRGMIREGRPKEWHCTADLVAYLGSPRSLAEACKVAYGVELSKSVRNRMSGKRWSNLRPVQQEEMRVYALSDGDYCLRLWKDYAHEWPEHERRVSMLNRKISWHGVRVDMARVDAGIEQLRGVCEDALSRIPWYPAQKPLSPEAIAEECRAISIPKPASLAKDSEEFDLWLDQYSSKAPWAKALGEFRSANALLAKLETLKSRTRPGDGRVTMDYIYCGACPTARFSSGGGINMQNLARKPMFGVDFRACLIPKPGHKFVVVDEANIEVRTLNWLARNKELLDRLARGYNPYEAQAVQLGIWNGPVGTFRGSEKYQMVKGITLGCGYSMSAAKFMVSAPTLTGGQYRPTMAEAEWAVKKFRENNPKVVALWKNLGKALEKAATEEEGYRLDIKLPSGRPLRYRGLVKTPKGETPWGAPAFDITSVQARKGKMARVKTYGGLLTENASQALARDILVFHMLELDRRGCPIVMHTHDEIVAEVPEETADEWLRVMSDVMRTPPPWISDIPLDVDAKVMDFYQK